jgi:hypothetical protein
MNQQQLTDFFKLVQAMREAQIKFYSNRTDSNLREARRLESRVDQQLQALNITPNKPSQQINFF